MRRLTALIAALIATMVFAACGGSSSTPSSTFSNSNSSDTSVRISNSSYDKADPIESGCSATAVTVPGSVTVRFNNAKKFGTLILVRSTACQTIWGEIKGITKSHVDVQLEALRIKPHEVAPFHTADGTPTKKVFGNMLSYRQGCVFVVAKVLPNGPPAEIGCPKG